MSSIQASANKNYVIDMDRLQTSTHKGSCFNKRMAVNIFNAGAAAVVSASGGCVGGFFSFVPVGVFFGGLLGGIGNGLSTRLYWEKENDQLCVETYFVEVPKLANRVKGLEDTLTDLAQRIQAVSAENLFPDLGAIQIPPVDLSENDLNCIWRTEPRRNFIKVVVIAGGVAALGGLIGGFITNTAGIISGAVLSGIANGISTWLSYEPLYTVKKERYVTVVFPQLLKAVEGVENKLNEQIERIRGLHPEVLVDFTPASAATMVFEREPDQPKNCMLSTRLRRNFIYINVATWMSSAGTWLAGYVPTPAGITAGSIIAGAANAISTWLVYEKDYDLECEKIILQDFPKLLEHVTGVSSSVLQLENAVQQISVTKPVLKKKRRKRHTININ